MKTEKILVVGDIHGCYGYLNSIISKKNPQIVLQCGDFGYFPNSIFRDSRGNIHYWKMEFKNKNTKIYWIDGNHEDHWGLSSLENNEIYPNVFYMKRGSILTLSDGRNVLFMGGALSIDKHDRIEGIDWFREETITQKDLMNIPDKNIDIVISHTLPNEFDVFDYHIKFDHDTSRDALSTILEYYKPDLWFGGHMHTFKTGKYLNTKWTCLSYAGHYERWWCWL